MPFSAILASAFVLLAQKPSLETKLDYSNPGSSARHVLADLSKRTGLALEAAPQTANEVLAVRFANVSLSEAMNRIAWAVDGGWKSVGEGYRLVRSSEQEREEERIEHERTAARYREMLEARRKDLAAAAEFTSQDAEKIASQLSTILKAFKPNDQRSNFWERARALDSKGPPGRALDKLAMLLDPNELAEMPSQIKVVYSTQPTPTQRPMGSKAVAIIDQYVREQGVWAQAATQHQIHNPQIGSTTYILGGLTGNTESLSGRVGKVLLSVYKWGDDDPPQLHLMVADQKGKILAECEQGFTLPVPTKVTGTKAAEPKEPKEPKMKVPAPVLAFQRAWDHQKKAPLPADLKEVLMHPEKTDPLSLASGGLLLAIADNQKASLVANLPDSSIAISYNQEEVAPATYLNTLCSYLFDREKADGWVLLRPKSLSHERKTQIDRTAFGNYVRTLVMNGKTTLDQQAEFLIHCPEDAHSTFRYVAEAALGVDRTDYADETTLRFYGSMSPDQKLAAQKGGITLPSLTRYQIHLLDRMLGGIYTNMQYTPAANGARADYELFYNGIYKEITEALPNGAPPATTITLKVDTSEVVTAEPIKFGEVNYGQHSFTPQDFAWHRFALEKPEFFPWMKDENDHIDFSKLRVGTRTSYNFVFQFTPELSLRPNLQSSDFGTNKSVGYEGLPESFRSQVEAGLEQYRKSYANRKAGDFGVSTTGSIPP